MTAPPVHSPASRALDRPRSGVSRPDAPPDDAAYHDIARPDVARADIVTASELVRHFGLWQDRATRAPVYVMFRGRPRLVLTSIEVMEALVAPHVPSHDIQGPDAVALLDLIRDMVVIADADLRITATSRTARMFFGPGVTLGVSADTLVPIPSRDLLLKTMRHVMIAGSTQIVDLPSPRCATGLLTLTIEPHRRGVALRIENVPGLPSLPAPAPGN